MVMIMSLINGKKNDRGGTGNQTTYPDAAVSTLPSNAVPALDTMEYIEPKEQSTTFWEGEPTETVSGETVSLETAKIGDQIAMNVEEILFKNHRLTEFAYRNLRKTFKDSASFLSQMLVWADVKGATNEMTLQSIFSLTEEVDVQDTVIGDLVFFRNDAGFRHAGIYIGSNQMIHIKNGVCRNDKVSSEGCDFVFGRVYPLTRAEADKIKELGNTERFYKPTLIEAPDNIKALFDNKVTELEVCAGDYLCRYSGNVYAEHIWIVEINNTKWKDICTIAMIADADVLPMVIDYHYDTGKFTTTGDFH